MALWVSVPLVLDSPLLVLVLHSFRSIPALLSFGGTSVAN